MQGVPSRHPPGATVMVSGDITRYALSMQSFMGLIAPAGSVVAWNTGVLIAKSINLGFQTVMDNPKLEWAWIMGDDHTYDADTILRLLEHDVEVVVPLCLNRMPPLDPTVIEHSVVPGVAGRMKYLEDMPGPGTGLYKLKQNETCGDAGLLIRKSALKKIGTNWYERKKSGAHAAEDQEFIARCKDAGIDIHVDPSVQLGHIGHVNFLPVWKEDHWEVRLMGGGARHVCDVVTTDRRKPELMDAAE